MIHVMYPSAYVIVIGIWIAKSATTVSEVSDSKPQKRSIKRLSLGLQLVLIVVGFNSLDLLLGATVNSIIVADQFLLDMAMDGDTRIRNSCI